VFKHITPKGRKTKEKGEKRQDCYLERSGVNGCLKTQGKKEKKEKARVDRTVDRGGGKKKKDLHYSKVGKKKEGKVKRVWGG